MKAVVFDMDGVIFDSEKLVLESWKMVANKYQIPYIEQAFRSCLGLNAIKSKENFFKKYGTQFPYDTYKKEASAYFHAVASQGGLALKPGVRELLNYLRKNHYKIGLATSTRKAVVIDELTMAGILEYFDAVICGDMVLRGKPEPDIYLMACESLQVKPNLAYGIEDSYNGIKSCYYANLKPIMVPDMLLPNEEMKELSYIILKDLYEVCNFMKQEDFNIINAKESDQELIMQLYHDMIGTPGCTWDTSYPNEEIFSKDINNGNLYVAKNSADEIIATISIDQDQLVDELPNWTIGNSKELSRLAVRQDYQNKGIARRMILTMMDLLKMEGIEGARFLVSPQNDKALASYQKLNFSQVGTTFLYNHEWYCYEKTIN